jgi:hypothetical protein
MPLHIGQIAKPARFSSEGFQFPLMDMHNCIWKIWQTATVIKMHMG